MSASVLVTGANGFVGSATVLELLKRGFKVKAAVRRQASADAFNAKYPSHASSISWELVPALTDQESMTSAARDVDYMIHVASPYFFTFKDNVNDVLVPARDGTLVALRAAAQNPRIKRVVVTSSFAAVANVSKGLWPEKTYSYQDWNPATWEEAATSTVAPFVYTVSKAVAEQAAWEFMSTQRPHFALTTFCPPMVYGPPAQPFSSLDGLNESVSQLWNLWSGKAKEVPPTRFPVMVDVRDLAYLQVDALTNPKAAGQRYLAVAHHFSLDQAVAIVRDAFPEHAARMPPTTGAAAPEHYKTDVEKTESDFGIKWIPFAKTMVDTAAAVFKAEVELEKKLE